MNTYIVEGGIGKCTAFTSLIPKLKQKSEVQIYTPYIDCFANNPDVKLVLEQTLPLQDQRIMASDNIYYSEPYKSNFQFGKQHIIESYCELHGVEYDKSMLPKLYTEQHKDTVKEWLTKNKIGKYLPGTKIIIKNYKKSKIDKNLFYFLGAWNFKKEIFYKERNFLKKGGKFILHLPKPTIFERMKS